MPLLPFIPIIGQLLDRVLPDPKVAEEAKQELAKIAVTGELQQIMGQLEINKVEAASSSLFVSGWRPYIGWVCGTALGYTYILAPFLSHFTSKPLPELSLTELMPVLLALLGLGSLRTYEKTKGVA